MKVIFIAFECWIRLKSYGFSWNVLNDSLVTCQREPGSIFGLLSRLTELLISPTFVLLYTIFEQMTKRGESLTVKRVLQISHIAYVHFVHGCYNASISLGWWPGDNIERFGKSPLLENKMDFKTDAFYQALTVLRLFSHGLIEERERVQAFQWVERRRFSSLVIGTNCFLIGCFPLPVYSSSSIKVAFIKMTMYSHSVHTQPTPFLSSFKVCSFGLNNAPLIKHLIIRKNNLNTGHTCHPFIIWAF